MEIDDDYIETLADYSNEFDSNQDTDIDEYDNDIYDENDYDEWDISGELDDSAELTEYHEEEHCDNDIENCDSDDDHDDDNDDDNDNENFYDPNDIQRHNRKPQKHKLLSQRLGKRLFSVDLFSPFYLLCVIYQYRSNNLHRNI